MDKRTAVEKRSNIMRHIRSKNTEPEIILRRALWNGGIRYRKNYKQLPGKPDIAITKYKIAIFCDGEFWHGKDWPSIKARLRGNREYWLAKIERNMARDNDVDKQLYAMGWTVLHFWGEDIKKCSAACVDEVRDAIFQAQMAAYDTDQ